MSNTKRLPILKFNFNLLIGLIFLLVSFSSQAKSDCREAVKRKNLEYCKFDNGRILKIQYDGHCDEMIAGENNFIQLIDLDNSIIESKKINSNLFGHVSKQKMTNRDGSRKNENMQCKDTSYLGMLNLFSSDSQNNQMSLVLISSHQDGALKVDVEKTMIAQINGNMAQGYTRNGYVTTSGDYLMAGVYTRSDLNSQLLKIWDSNLKPVAQYSKCYFAEEFLSDNMSFKNKAICYSDFGETKTNVVPLKGFSLVSIDSQERIEVVDPKIEWLNTNYLLAENTQFVGPAFDTTTGKYMIYFFNIIDHKQMSLNIEAKNGNSSDLWFRISTRNTLGDAKPITEEIKILNYIFTGQSNQDGKENVCILNSKEYDSNKTIVLNTNRSSPSFEACVLK